MHGYPLPLPVPLPRSGSAAGTRSHCFANSAWLQAKPPHKLLWPGGWINHAAKMVRADLDAARAAWIRFRKRRPCDGNRKLEQLRGAHSGAERLPKMVPFCQHWKRWLLHRIPPMKKKTGPASSSQLRKRIRLTVSICTKLRKIARKGTVGNVKAPPGFEPGMADLQSAAEFPQL